jgi:AraC-like DNA-binding protein
MNEAQQKELVALTDKFSNGNGVHETAVPGLTCIKVTDLHTRMPTVYNPSLCIVVQGSKEVILDTERYHYAPPDYLIISVDLPVIGQITKASANSPYLCLKIDIDQRLLSELVVETSRPAQVSSSPERGFFIGKLDSVFCDGVVRLARLLDTPKDIAFFAPIITREIHYRLLNSKYCTIISQLAENDSKMQRIATVIQKLKTEFDKPIRIEEMAQLASMSVSTFHLHFKEITAMSPLQYQKSLRLIEARRIMLSDAADAADTAFRVGYESPSQFSREYARMFGAPPARDIARLRSAQGRIETESF